MACCSALVVWSRNAPISMANLSDDGRKTCFRATGEGQELFGGVLHESVTASIP